MLRLTLSNEPRWMDFGGGLRLLLRPADMDLIGEAQNSPAIADLIPETGDTSDLASDDRLAFGKALAGEVARLAVVEWEGVGDEDGKPIAKPWPEGIDALMRIPAVFTKFQSQYLQPAMMLADEGNASGPAPSGTSAGARTTARPVPRGARTARKKSTSRKR